MLEVVLNPIPGHEGRGRRVAYLRELRGHKHQLDLAALNPASLSEMLFNLLVDVPGAAIGPGRVSTASVGDRDLLVAALYTGCFGDAVVSEVRCTVCAGPFEVRFSLAEEIAIATRAADEAAQREQAAGPDAEGFYRLPSGVVCSVADRRGRARAAGGAGGRAAAVVAGALRADKRGGRAGC